MTMRRNVARGAAIALIFAGLLRGATSEAQVTTGTIVGTVKDQQGAAVPGAAVTITETNKGTLSTHTTDPAGSFVAPFLIPGTYEVAVELAGFKKYTHRGVVLQVNQRARVDATLEVGGLTEATEVIGLAPLTRTDSAELGEVIEERAVRELPLNGRNFATLVYLVPGVPAGPRTSTRSARRPTPTPGWWTASTTTSSPSTPSSCSPRSSRCASSRC